MKHTSKFLVASLVALSGSTALATTAAQAETISFILCGDQIFPSQERAIADWEEANPDYPVDVQLVGWAQCQDRATQLAIAGDPVGLAYVGSRTVKQYALNDLIVEIPMTEEEQASYHNYVPETVTFEGTQWGVPVAFSTKALYWNKDLYEEAGLDPDTPPKTWEEKIAFAKQITENTDAAGYGVVAKTMDNTMHQFLHWVYSNNGQVIDADGNIVLNSPENLEALTALRDIVPYGEEGPTAYEQNEVRAIWLDGGVAMIEAMASAGNLAEEAGMNWGVAPLPQGPSAEGPGTLLITDSLVVFKGTGYEDKAIEFAKFLTQPEYQWPYEQENGLTPLRPSEEVEQFVSENPEWAPLIDGIEHGGPEPLFTDYIGLQNVMIEMVQSVVTGQAEPEAALEQAAAELEQYK
ncbi:ABC transporter substrate-binding protein [Devosia sp. RR2S18]|uniref:ABC transporter substrate-binding protein n=1 Tax=Devosia rhizosphaerae TaxID=3049774 RepID=UPI0025400725|nr:extracellular solute-binding protein [Devosia sp. RR2S18]WIJ25971.1 extracellular solute-binding protein [Devosia sp. RR2S18]